MYSDMWLSNGCKCSERYKLNECVDYNIWYDSSKEPVGITVNFEYADDFHVEVKMDDMDLFMQKMFGVDNFLDHTEVFTKYLNDSEFRAQFELDLNHSDIKYHAIHF